MSRAARARRHDELLREHSDDERSAIRARGDVPPNRDGSPSTVIASKPDGCGQMQCSCGARGEVKPYIEARDEARRHRCGGAS